MSLLKDDNLDVKLRAIRSLGRIQATDALADLHSLLQDTNIHIKTAAVEALSGIAAPESVPVLQAAIFDAKMSVFARLPAFTALQKIGTDRAIQIMVDAAKQDEKTFGLKACVLLGELGEKAIRTALPWLSMRLMQLEKDYDQWRRIRDTETRNMNEEERAQWEAQFKTGRPGPDRALKLAEAIARVDPQHEGFKLLSHDLADVRKGAWTGLSQVGDVNLLKRLHEERRKSKDPFYRHAAYRAIDLLLLRLEGSGSPQDLAGLEDLYPQVEKEEGVGTRVEWTINQLKERLK